MLVQSSSADNWYSIVRWKIVAIIDELHEAVAADQAVRGVPGDKIDLTFGESTVSERQIHLSYLLKVEAVGLGETRIAVRPRHEILTKARAPLRRDLGRIADGF